MEAVLDIFLVRRIRCLDLVLTERRD